jgi:hypothetical protein
MRPLPSATNPGSHRRWDLVPVAAVLTALALSLPALPAGAADWPVFNIDSRHNGNNQQETIINSGNVSTLHVLYHVTLPSVADGPPVFLTGVATASGIKDLLFLTTKAGHILALDAATGATIWSHQPATGPNYTTSSPAIDPNRLYVYSYGLEGKVHKYQVGDGTEITTGGWPQLTTNKPSVEKCSPPLSVAVTNGGIPYLYVAHGGYPGDAGDYQGHITAINLSTGTQNVFNVMCSDQTVHFAQSPASPDCAGGVQSAVWGRPAVLYSTELDRIFFTTSNGTYNASTGGHFWGDSVLALHPDGTGTGMNGMPLDSYTPTEFQTLQDDDADLGSTSPALLPPIAGSRINPLAVQSGKDGQLRLLNLNNMSGAGAPAHVAREVLPQPVVWVNPIDSSVWVFVTNGSGISGIKVTVDGGGNPGLAVQWNQGPGGSSALVANGMLFYNSSSGIMALDPTTGNQLFSDSSPSGLHWESPILIDGRLFVGDESANLWAYGPNAAPLGFFTLPPCRVVDTRRANGPFGGPAIGGGGRRSFQIAGQCGVPTDAKAVAANVTVVVPGADGFISVAPSGIADISSNVSFKAGEVRAGNGVIDLTGDPLGAVWASYGTAGTGATNLLIDVSGYFK